MYNKNALHAPISCIYIIEHRNRYGRKCQWISEKSPIPISMSKQTISAANNVTKKKKNAINAKKNKKLHATRQQ